MTKTRTSIGKPDGKFANQAKKTFDIKANG
jgi:hypothetical protein